MCQKPRCGFRGSSAFSRAHLRVKSLAERDFQVKWQSPLILCCIFTTLLNYFCCICATSMKRVDGHCQCQLHLSQGENKTPHRKGTSGIQKGNQPITEYLPGNQRPDRLDPVPQTGECEGNQRAACCSLAAYSGGRDSLIFWRSICQLFLSTSNAFTVS